MCAGPSWGAEAPQPGLPLPGAEVLVLLALVPVLTVARLAAAPRGPGSAVPGLLPAAGGAGPGVGPSAAGHEGVLLAWS